MRLYVGHVHSNDASFISVKRSPLCRSEWVKFYDDGNRLFRIMLKDGDCYAVLNERPHISGGSITFKLSLLLVNEAWGGRDGRLCSVFVWFKGMAYHGQAINGWAFKPIDYTVKLQPNGPSPEAREIAFEFITKQLNINITNNERQANDDTTNNSGSPQGANDAGGIIEDTGVRLPI